MESQRIVAVSGGFDPVHPGHIRLFRTARELAGDGIVMVILNNDNWLRAKKGYVFMPQEDRAEVLRAIIYVDAVIVTGHSADDPDMSVGPELRMYRPDVFLNGGDRGEDNTPEKQVCEELGIEMVFNGTEGHEYSNHSSTLIKNASDALHEKA